MMKLLLISLQSNAFITGLKYVAASARAHGHDVRILFMPGYMETDLLSCIKDFINDFKPDLIGISLMSLEFYPVKNLTRLLKRDFDIPIIWGGVHTILRPEECIAHCDFVCTGEGEHIIVSLLDHIQNNGRDQIPQIKGLWINRNGEIIKNPPALPENNLDRFPFQEYLPGYFYGLHENNIYNFSVNENLFRRYALYGGLCHMAITTRGCPFSCSYCGNSALSKVYGRKVRERSVSNVIEELKSVRKNPYVLYINFQDDCFFTHSMEWIEEFSREYRNHVGLPFVARVIPSMMDRSKFLKLKETGLCWIVMGIQSGSDRVNYEVYDRRIKFDAVRRASEIISETRVAPFYEMIVDNPYESDDERIETIDKMSELKKPYTISLAHLTYFPGTPLADRAISDNIANSNDYLYQYILKIENTYYNKLLGITPYIPRSLVKYLNVPASNQNAFHRLVLTVSALIAKSLIEPATFLFVVMRSFNYRIDWTFRTVAGNWKSAMSRLVSNYLGKGDKEYDQKMIEAKKKMPEIFSD
jgi:radical SAM superfamily enzyme YgiQ (UPF0313 family)